MRRPHDTSDDQPPARRGQTLHVLRSGLQHRMGQSTGPSTEASGVPSGPDEDPVPIPTDGTKTYFAEGAAGVFSYRLALLNTTSTETSATVSFLREGDSPVQRVYNLPSLTRVTVNASDVPELRNTSFGTILSTGPGVVAERTMGWNAGGAMAGGPHRQGDHQSRRQTWYLAEGNAGFFDTFILLANPQTSRTNVHGRLLLDDGQSGDEDALTIAGAGTPDDLREPDPRTVDAFVRHDVHADQADPVRARDVLQERRHDVPRRLSSAAVPAGSTHCRSSRKGRRATSSRRSCCSRIRNPDAGGCDDPLSDQRRRGARRSPWTMAPTSRQTIVADALPEIAATDVSFDISATKPIIAERSMSRGPWARRAQQHGHHRPRHAGAGRRGSRRAFAREFVHPARQPGNQEAQCAR